MVFPILDLLEPCKLSLCVLRSRFCVFRPDRKRPLKAFERHSIRVEEIIEKTDPVLNHDTLALTLILASPDTPEEASAIRALRLGLSGDRNSNARSWSWVTSLC